MNLRIVLVEPREAGNVGAAARAMKNFGFTDLTIVGEHPELHPLADWWSSGAEDLIRAIRFAPTLQAALADCNLTVATTSARGRSALPSLSPRELAAVSGELAEGQVLALVFGREDRGLTGEEVSLCHRTASIPTSPDFPTMNLAQSVSLFCYEISRSSPEREKIRQLASAETVERLHERLQALLVEAGFLHQNNPDRIYREMRSWVSRLELDQREAEVLLGAIRQLEWKVGK